MKQTTLDSLTVSEPKAKYTGDPFVDVGALVMERFPQKTVEGKIRFVTDVYVDIWKGKLNSVFLHSKITHISLTGKPAIQKKGALEYYFGISEEKGFVSDGYCRVCSNKGHLFEGGRHNFPMVGFAEFTNFCHFQEPSLMICKNCLIKLYFLPIGLLQGRNLMFLQIQDEYARKLCRQGEVRCYRGRARSQVFQLHGRIDEVVGGGVHSRAYELSL